jgi:hypothetical protein
MQKDAGFKLCRNLNAGSLTGENYGLKKSASDFTVRMIDSIL